MKLELSVRRKGAIVPLFIVVAIALSGCASSSETRSAKHMEAGKKLLQKKDASRAILEFKTAIQATPKNAETHYQLALAYLAAGDLGKGVASLRRTLELNPKHTAAQLALAQLMANAPDQAVLKDAQQRLEELLQDNPDNVDALHTLALTELKLGDPKDAMQHLQRAMAAAPRELVLAVTLAQAKLQQKDVKGAEEVLKKACADSPKSVDCVVILGRLYAAENRLPEAEQMLRQALGMDPNHVAGLLNLARLQNTAGRKQEAEQTFKRLSSLSDKTYKPYHAIFLFEEGRRDEAIKEFEALAKQEPDDRMARTRLVAAYQAVNKLPAAQRILSDALKNNPKDLEALLQRGEIFLSDGKYQQAEADLNQVLHLKPDSPEVHYALAKLHQARGATLRRREELNQVLRLNPFLVEARLELAKSMIGENAKAALGILDGAPGDQKRLISIVEQRNWALLNSAQLIEARKGVDQGLARARTLDFLLQDAVLKVIAKRYTEARQPLHEAMAKAPEDLRALKLLVRSYAAEKQVPAAVEQVRAHALKNPKSAAVQYFLGNLLLETGSRAQAKQVLASAKAVNPEYTPFDLSLAQIDLTQANWKDAREELMTILAKGENPLARKWLGMLELSVGNQAAAIADFRKVIEIQPDNAVALNDLAYLLAENGDQVDQALKYAEKAVELAPDNPDIEDTLGWVFYRKGLYQNAVTHLQSSISKGGGARQHYHLAMACFKAGNQSRGHAALQAALLRDPSLPEAKLAQQASQEKP